MIHYEVTGPSSIDLQTDLPVSEVLRKAARNMRGYAKTLTLLADLMQEEDVELKLHGDLLVMTGDERMLKKALQMGLVELTECPCTDDGLPSGIDDLKGLEDE